MALDPSDTRDYFKAFLKTRASLDATDVTVCFTGNIYSYGRPEGSRHLFSFDGVNLARVEKTANGYRMLSREAGVYRDPESGEILRRWRNPFTGAELEVIHLWNDPVNNTYDFDKPPVRFGAKVYETRDNVAFAFDALIDYPSPLPVAEYPKNSSDDVYRAAELLQFITPRAELEDDSSHSSSCVVSWTRLSQWLPWMEMGSEGGGLLYHCHGVKLPEGAAGLPADFREFLEAHGPQYFQAPESWVEPNETSWTYFKKLQHG
ncbi:DUF1838 family protein [Sphaerimonospora sp. CA-214678]|uniref:DUF1838 family protein n=1 Tax=Sphaerimonospora sp. CA-214678 TaxID=3240029 RepID=UPI003D943928